MRLNTEVKLIELAKLLVLIVGGMLAYFLIDKVSAHNDKLLIQKQFLEELPDFYPNLKINYTNQFNSNGDSLYSKVYLENKGRYPVWVYYPIVKLLDEKQKDNGDYFTENLKGFSGLISPGSSFEITYLNQADTALHKFAKLDYKVEVDKHLKTIYGCLFQDVLDNIDEETFNYITTKHFGYMEKTYLHDTNPNWDNFFENPI